MSTPDITPIPLAAGENPPVPGAVKISQLNKKGKHHSGRTKARKAVLDALFEADMQGTDPVEALLKRQEQELADGRQGLGAEEAWPFAQRLTAGIKRELLAIDQRIAESLTGDWTIERMPAIDRNLARIAVWELDHSETDPRTAIHEALELADEFSTDESVAFLNGVLGRIAATRN